MVSNRYSKQGSYVTGACVSGAEGWLVLTMDELVAKDIANAGFFYLKDTMLAPLLMRRFRVRFASLLPGGSNELIAVGEYGQCVTIAHGGAVSEEQISANAVVPESRGPLRAGAVVAGQIIVVGMDRQVYRREAPGAWVTMEDGLPRTGNTSGFEAVAGHTLQRLYAVGWDGEIWRFDGARWSAIVSPTNRILTSVCIDAGDTVYACGRNGMILRAKNDQWEVLDTGCPDDLWEIVSFRGEVFAASLRRLYRLQGDVLEPVDADSCESFATFSKCGDALWSIGAKAVIAYDGQRWTQIA